MVFDSKSELRGKGSGAALQTSPLLQMRWRIILLSWFSVLIVFAVCPQEHKRGTDSSGVISLSFVSVDGFLVSVGAICLGQNAVSLLTHPSASQENAST